MALSNCIGATTAPGESAVAVVSDAKSLGAYYTDAHVAEFLADWALRSPTDTVIDPSFGGGVFLDAACKRLLKLGGSSKRQVFGVEIDAAVHRQIADKLVGAGKITRKNLVCADFFSDGAAPADSFDAVIGNPPFIRYQRFSGEARAAALRCAAAAGVRLPELCSSWAFFVIHSIAMVRRGGRLAMVLPMELAHAKYARPVLEHLRQSFRSVRFLTFQEKLFPDLSEDTLLLLAEDKAGGPGRFALHDFEHAGSLAELGCDSERPFGGERKMPASSIAAGRSRLIEYLIPVKARRLYQQLKDSEQARRLASFADVGIGYVTGANDYFHLSAEEVAQRKIPREFLKPVVRRGRALNGLRFTADDWHAATVAGDGGYLLHIPKERSLPAAVREYVRDGESQQIDQAYKCRVRSPWYCVPHVHRPDAFLTYMSGTTPRLVVNAADAYAPNTLHVVRFHPLFGLPPDAVSALWQTSLTRLSVELEGHALGGGMLKLEPTEAGNTLIACPANASPTRLRVLAQELDEIARSNKPAAAQQYADRVLLQDLLGLSAADCRLLRSAAEVLHSRRYGASTRGTT